MKEGESQNKAFQQSQDYNEKTPSNSNTLRNIKNNAYFDFQQEYKPIDNQYKQSIDGNFSLDLRKLELVNQMLHILGYKESIQALKAQTNLKYQCRNPENSSAQKKTIHKSDVSLNARIQNIVKDNTPFEEMLQSLSFILKQQNEQKMIEQKPDNQQYRQAINNPKLERAIQHLFPIKQNITLPIYKQLEIQCGNREIRFVDIEQQGSICLFDSQNSLYLATAHNRSTKLIRTKVDQKRHIIDMKWINSQLIILLTSTNKMLFYNASQLQNVKTIKRHRLSIINHHICVMKVNKTSQAKNCYVLSASQHRLLPIKLNLQANNITEESMPYFQQNYSLKAITVIKVPHKVTFHRALENQTEEKQFNIVTDIQHYYGLAKNSKKIIKFDTIVQKSGVIWESGTKEIIWQLKNSNCGYFLQVLLIAQKKSFKNSNENKICNFLKMSGSGCVLQKTDLSLTSLLNSIHLGFDQIFQKLIAEKNGVKWHKMSPQWIRCYSYKNNLIYFSIKSGSVIFSQQIEQNDIKIYCVGNRNNVIYQSNGKIVLLSTIEKHKNTIVLQNRRSLDMRETLIQRFSRLHGIPENLLLLLRSIRNNDIELMQIGD